MSADITATATLDIKAFTQGLQAAQREADRWRNQVMKGLAFDPLSKLNFALRQVKGNLADARGLKLTIDTRQATAELDRSTDAAKRQKRELTDAEQAVIKYRNATLSLYNEVRKGVVSQAEGIKLARQLGAESLAAAQKTERWSSEYRQLLVASGRAESILAQLQGRVTAVGHSQSVAIGTTQGLSTAYQQLAGSLAAVFATTGLVRYVGTLRDFSREAATARNTIALFFAELEKNSLSADRGQAAISKLAQQFNTTEEAVASNMTILVRFGATVEQAMSILEAGAASAVNFGRLASEGFENVASAIISGRSTLLNAIGIAKDLGPAYREYARSIGKAYDELTNFDKVQAAQLLLLSETRSEVEALPTIYAGFVGAQQRLNRSVVEFRKALGRGSETFLTPLFNTASRLLNAFTALPESLQRIITTTSLLAVTVGGLAIAYATVRSVLARVQIVQTLVNALVARETVERTRLGTALVGLAARYRLLTREQLVANATAIRASKGMTIWAAGIGGVKDAAKGLVTLLGKVLRGVRGFITSPLGGFLAAVGGGFLLINHAVEKNQRFVKPAMDGMRKAIGDLREATAGLWRRFDELTGISKAVADVWRQWLIAIAQKVAIALSNVTAGVRSVAAAMQFLNDVTTVGPRQAWANFQAAIREIEADLEKAKTGILETARAVRSGAESADLAGESLLRAGEKAAMAKEDFAALREEAEDTAHTFKDRLANIRIGLISDDQMRELATARRDFAQLREEIREAAEENSKFAPFAEGLIAESFELEQKTVNEIQRRYAEERREQAERQAQELADAIRDRERAIVDEQTRGQLNEAEALTLAYQRRIEDTKNLYSELIERTRKNGLDTTRLEQQLTAELLAIHQGYERDVTALYDQIYEEIGDRRRDLIREAAESRGDSRTVLGLDYQADLRALDDFYSRAKALAAGNAERIATIEEAEVQERRALRERYWSDVVALAAERGEAILQREETLAAKRAELAGDDAAALRVAHAASIREIQRTYDQLERAAAGNADELARIAKLRNEEVALANAKLADDLKAVADTQAAEAFTPILEKWTEGLDDASQATLDNLTAQLRNYRVVYGANGEVVKLIDAALAQVSDRSEEIAEEAAKHIEEVLETAQGLTERFRLDHVARGLSDVETELFEAAQRVQELEESQADVMAALATATGESREALIRESHELASALEDAHADILADAERIVTGAIDEYQRGLEDARLDASEAAVGLVESDVSSIISRISGVQTTALREARMQLLRLVATLVAQGVDEAALAPLRAQVAELDATLVRSARSAAEFGAEQHRALREVAGAVLDEAAARRVANQTHTETIRLRKAALEEAKREGATLEELAELTQALTGAQLEYMGHLEGQISDLRDLQGEYRGTFQAASDLADLLDVPVPEGVIDAQEQLATAALESVRAAQEAGQGYAEYNEQLSEAVSLWRDFSEASVSSIRATVDGLRREHIADGLVPNENRIRDVARRMAEVFGVTTQEAFQRVMQAITGELGDPLAGLELRQPTVLSEIFENLNAEATSTPETLAAIDAQIETLEQRVEDLKATVAEAVDFEAAGQQLLTGYRDVLEAIEGETVESFDELALKASSAFTARFQEESGRLRDELKSAIGPVVDAAGLTAGEGLMTAFASGVTANKQLLLNAVEDVLQDVRQRLPSSDAKRGPLSDLTHSGQMLVRTFLGGAQAERRRLSQGISRLMASARPSAAFTAATAGVGVGGAGSPITMNIDGRPAHMVPGPLALNARALVRSAMHEINIQQRLRGRKP